MMLQCSLIAIVTLLFTFCNFVSSGPHVHEHREKEEHGAYSPRDTQHYKEGRHHSEFDHEAVLGSRLAAEEFDQLGPDEAKKRLKELAKKMDKDKDGHVDKEELTQWVLHSFRLLTEEESLERLEEEDANVDGHVDWPEHLQETFGAHEDEANDVDSIHYADERRMIDEDRELFQAADANHDGILNQKEFAAFSHPEEFDYMHRTLLLQTLRKKDSDGDGALDLNEYLKEEDGRPADKNSEYYAIEADKFKQDYDKDEDGKLDHAEILAWLIPDNREMAETEAEHLIESSDEDQDGRLSIDEIVDHHDVFVGSEATDFGEHLQNTHKFNDEL